MPHILVVDDEPKMRAAVTRLLTHYGHTVDEAESGEHAIRASLVRVPDLIVMDMSMPGMTGLQAFIELRARDPYVVCIFVTAYGSIPAAVDAIRAGGFDYVAKPFDNDKLLFTIDRGLEQRALRLQVRQLRDDLESRTNIPGIVGRSAAIAQVLRELSKVAASDAAVLLLGESGTGKELAARSVHRQSRRAGGPFVPVNCGAVPLTLAEVEFFGHERGAFTDAKEARPGRFEQASGGTLFLDEVGELPLGLQAMLLRALQDKVVTRVGASQPTPVDVRVVAATNRDLSEAIRTGQFREDFYWRLAGVTLRLPPLRDRLEDLDLLADHLVDRLSAELGVTVGSISDGARRQLHSHRWPGNVRELENVLRRALIMAEGPAIEIEDLRFMEVLKPKAGAGTSGPVVASSLAETVARSLDDLERHAIEAALIKAQGNRSEAARALGIGRRTLFTKIKRLGLARDEDDASD